MDSLEKALDRLSALEAGRTELFTRLDESGRQLGEMLKWTENEDRMAVLEADRAELFARLDENRKQLDELRERLEEMEARLHGESRVAALEADRTELFARLDENWKQLGELRERLAETESRREDDSRMTVVEADRTELFARVDSLDQRLQADEARYREESVVQRSTLLRSVSDVWNSMPRQGDRRPRIHFVRCLDIYNTGDMNCGPDLYFKDLTRGAACFYHSIKNVAFDMIERTDWVILGGGGLLDCSEQYQTTINRLLELSDHVVSWGAGHNSHREGAKDRWDPIVPIRYDRFFLFTSRDWKYGSDRFCPCVSCMMPGLERTYPIKRKIGVLSHHEIRIGEFSCDICDNEQPLDVILEFIGSSEVIITNTYHGTYWATLMGKKVILYRPFSNRFDHFRYPPTRYSGDLEADIGRARTYPQALAECREINMQLKAELMSAIWEGAGDS